MSSKDKYRLWLTHSYFDKSTRKELEAIGDNEEEIEERFYKDLEFGTGGLRGIIGAGTNRMNIYTVRRASQGIAAYVKKNAPNYRERGIAIAYDSRHKSHEFAMESALVFAANGIKAWLFDELKPTPVLSFAVRYLKAAAGIVITASHNPGNYNGYKVYGDDGGQLTPEYSNQVTEEINSIEDITRIKPIGREEAYKQGLLKVLGSEIDDAYMDILKSISLNPQITREAGKSFKLIYTPIHGTGNKPVRRILKETGFENVLTVNSQEKPDPDFSTVEYPNPEDPRAFDLALKLAKKENVSLIIGTDPDCDRMGIMVRNTGGQYIIMTGNQIGCLMMDYILSQKKEKGILPRNGLVVTTIVSSELAAEIAKKYSVKIINVLTGFKFIGEKIKKLDDKGDKVYLFGFEESYGYLAGTHARDKDGVVASMLIAEIAAFYYQKNMSVYEALIELYEKYGYFLEDIESYYLEGKEGAEKIKSAMESLRQDRPEKFGCCEVRAITDYIKSERYDIKTGSIEKLDFPLSNVLYFEMNDKSWFCVRPSGTEPKIKIYFGVSEKNMAGAENKLTEFKNEVLGIVKDLLDL